jgi:hypothetical protein
LPKQYFWKAQEILHNPLKYKHPERDNPVTKSMRDPKLAARPENSRSHEIVLTYNYLDD